MVAPAFEENGSVGVTLTNAFDIAVNSIIPLNLSDVFSLEGTVGITALNKHNESLVFPNPALREAPVFVQWSQPENGILTVYNAQGAKMHEEEVRNSSILALDFSKFAAGNYFIRLISENNSKVFKILLLDL
jgi:hypothetical protein